MAIKKVCKYTQNQERLKTLLVLRSANKTDEYDSEINKLQSEIDFFEYGIKPKNL